MSRVHHVLLLSKNEWWGTYAYRTKHRVLEHYSNGRLALLPSSTRPWLGLRHLRDLKGPSYCSQFFYAYAFRKGILR